MTKWLSIVSAGAAAALFALVQPTLAAGAGTLLTVSIDIEFQTEEVNIPGWEDGLFSEPVGAGRVEIRLVFPEAGGAPEFQAGDAWLDRYGCVGSAPCTCTPPPDLLGRQWHPVLLDRIAWRPDARLLTVMGPATFPEDETPIKVRCPPAPEVTVPDHPVYKLLGAFSESNEQRWPSGFEIPLVGPGPWTKVFERELFSDGPKVFRARLELEVSESDPS